MPYSYAEVSKDALIVQSVAGGEPFLPAPPPTFPYLIVDTTALSAQPSTGDIYDPAANTFSAPPPPIVLPTLVITSLQAIDADDNPTAVAQDLSEATIPVGAGVLATFQIQLPDGGTAPVDMPLVRMPVKATDGRTAYAVVQISQGQGTAEWHPEASGRWQITQDNINSELPEQARMCFAGLDVFVYGV